MVVPVNFQHARLAQQPRKRGLETSCLRRIVSGFHSNWNEIIEYLVYRVRVTRQSHTEQLFSIVIEGSNFRIFTAFSFTLKIKLFKLSVSYV